MKTNLQLLLLAAFALATGVLGTLLVQSDTAEAQGGGQFRECARIQQIPGWSHAGNAEHVRNPVGRFPIPRGWTVIGAGDQIEVAGRRVTLEAVQRGVTEAPGAAF